ncbi:Glyoxylate reductase [Gossypium arboreum]|uniref:Glyoxylate reductase n=1 Tax=Gossypium arboreum TaxID=29729 RepID=A0A0B0PHS1_GOSAR|nr:Glyoxylate reductase [Gossypium arboreum]KHG24452.1 Glyoxylate reductase [Gossypium arboreum]
MTELSCFYYYLELTLNPLLQQPEELPIVLVHRLPSYKIPLDPSFRDQLRSQFHMLDPHESPEPYDSFLARHATFIRVLMTIGHSPISRRVSGATACFGADSGNNLAFAEDVADCAVGLLIDVLRRISAADRFVRGRMWPVKENYPLGFKLDGKRVGIVGLGSIGSEVAKRLLAFGCTIAYTSRNKKQSVSFPFYANVRDLAANSDVLVLCCALTKETYHMINKDVMVALGKDGVIINVGRGSLINEKELVQCLVGGEMGGAGLDVLKMSLMSQRSYLDLIMSCRLHTALS